MAKAGWEVAVFEKHSDPGGRARKLTTEGFTFDMGPSWYWMPDVFDNFFRSFGKKTGDYYQLTRLDPSYRVYWSAEKMDVPANYDSIKGQFEQVEKGSGNQLDHFLNEARFKYILGMNKLVFSPGLSISEFLDWALVKGIFKLHVFRSIKAHICKFFKNPRLRQILEFPSLFLGALPGKTPALYSLMNYADIKLGTWYPEGGICNVAIGIFELAKSLGVRFYFSHDVTAINIENGMAKSITVLDKTKNKTFQQVANIIIGAADYQFIETKLLPQLYQSYSRKYWDSRKMAPSAFLYYIGLNKKVKGVLHHSLFFDESFDQHASDIYLSPKWPGKPLFYVCTPSVTDSTVAPEGCENLFFLIPVSAGLSGDSIEKRDEYFDQILTRFEKLTGENIRNSIVYRKTFGPNDFISEYNAFKGNAYGLANTLLQTAIFKPSCRSKKVSNLFYTGQLTVPGPGVPPALISGEVVAGVAIKYFENANRK